MLEGRHRRSPRFRQPGARRAHEKDPVAADCDREGGEQTATFFGGKVRSVEEKDDGTLARGRRNEGNEGGLKGSPRERNVAGGRGSPLRNAAKGPTRRGVSDR